MIVKRTSRMEILSRLRAKVERRVPVFIASAASGLVAQLLEAAGVDCVNTFSGARLRANGMGTMSMLWPILDSNRQTLDYTREDILPALTGRAFVCACLNANDPLKDMVLVLEDLKRMGVASVSNIGPSISYVDKDSHIYKVLTSAGVTLQNEIDMLRVAKEMGLVTIGLAFDEEDSCRVVAEAQPDVFCFHAGTTKGGLRGFDAGETIEETARRTETVNQKLRGLEPDLILIAHGAAMETPEEAQYMLDHTTCHGFWTGSSTERIPIEKAVAETAARFAALRFSSRAEPLPMPRVIAVLATLDTKGQQAQYVKEQLEALGSGALVVDLGVTGTPSPRGDVTRDEVALAGGTPLGELLQGPSREAAQPVMARGALRILQDRVKAGALHGVIGLGGLQGTAVHRGDAGAPLWPAQDHGLDRRLGKHRGLRRRHGHHHDVQRGRHHRPQRVPAQGAGQRRGRRPWHGPGPRRPRPRSGAASRSSGCPTSAS